MNPRRRLAACLALRLAVAPLAGGADELHRPSLPLLPAPLLLRDAAAPYQSVSTLLQESPAADWRTPDPQNLLYLDLAAGRVIIELAPRFAPLHAENVRALVREGFFDGLTINRVQDNYVAQWGDADEQAPRPIRH